MQNAHAIAHVKQGRISEEEEGRNEQKEINMERKRWKEDLSKD